MVCRGIRCHGGVDGGVGVGGGVGGGVSGGGFIVVVGGGVVGGVVVGGVDGGGVVDGADGAGNDGLPLLCRVAGCWERINTVLLRAQCGNVLTHAFLTYIKLSSKSQIELHVELG